ncbi:MAG TPA: hypothetical protein VJN70_12045 [Gemmatimonadaceae bacterium]|nr:hypothetical protein [Gemmatimonadaceae bacterium]
MRDLARRRPLFPTNWPATLPALAALLVGFVPIGRARAQLGGGVSQADSMLATGRVGAAESLYYATSSARPRDAVARAALGRYLAARGHLRIGAVLLEEARLFGGDTAGIARSLAPIYGSLGDYRALATLPASPLSSAEQKRVRWLVSHPPVLEFPDSVITVSYKPLVDGSGVGVVSLGIGERRVDALLDPRVSGVLLRGKAARRREGLRVFGEDSTAAVAIVSELHLGDVTLSNVTARLDTSASGTKRLPQNVVLGLDVLRSLSPAFDPAAQTITLRRGQIPPTTVGTRTPMLLDENGLRFVVDGHWETGSSTAAARLLGTQRWTVDAKHGILLLQ